MFVKAINIGRDNVNFEFEADNIDEIFDGVGRHLLSRDLEIIETDKDRTYNILAGFNNVGTIETSEQLKLG